MEEHDRLFFFFSVRKLLSRLERQLQPPVLSRDYLVKIARLGRVFPVRIPSSRAADDEISDFVSVVEQQFKRIETVLRKKSFVLRLRRPPEVVVALGYQLRPGKRIEKLKVRLRFFEVYPPRDVAAYDDRVPGRNDVFLVSFDPLLVILPSRTEDIHRL